MVTLTFAPSPGTATSTFTFATCSGKIPRNKIVQ
jgi:hypothetical protein